jgi:hypothetical protein
VTANALHAPMQGSCVGFEIRSELRFQALRQGGGHPMYVDQRSGLVADGEIVRTWAARPDNPFHGRLFKAGSRYSYWASDAGLFAIDPAVPSISVEPGLNTLRRELRLFGVPTAICAVEQGDLSIHASAVEIGGHGVLLAGPSRYGKTTLAAAFARAGHRLLSEDSIRCSPNGSPRIWPGPAALRLRSDVATQMSLPGARPATGEVGRVPLVIDDEFRGDGAAVQLEAIVILREASSATLLEPAPPVAVVRDLLALTFQLGDASSRGETFARVADLVRGVPAFDLHRPLTMESLAEVVNLVEGLVRAPR